MPKPEKPYPVRLTGTSKYPMAVGGARQGDQVHILREPSNPFDPAALVVVDGDGRTLGYVPRDNWLRTALNEEQRGARAVVTESDLGGLKIAVTLSNDGAIGERDFVPAD